MLSIKEKPRTSSAIQLSLMILVTTLTQVVAIYKSALIAESFGADTELDAYNFANNIISFVLTFASSGIMTVIIPAYVKRIERKAIDTFITITFSLAAFLIASIFIFRIPLVNLLTNRADGFTVYVSNVMLSVIFIQLLPALLCITTAYYQSVNRFTLPKVILLISNLIVVFLLLYKKNFSIYEYLNILLAGTMIQFILDISFVLYYGFRWKPSFYIHNVEYKKMWLTFIPMIFSVGIYKISTLIDSLLTTNLGEGQLTILSYSQNIVSMVSILIIGNLTAFFYPKLITSLEHGTKEGKALLGEYAVIFHAVVCIMIAGFASAGHEFVSLLYGRGKFTADAVDMLYICMTIYVFAQQNNVLRDIIYRYFFASGDTRTTVKNGILVSCLNIVFSVIFSQLFGFYGIVIGSTIASTISLLGIYVKFRIKFGNIVNQKTYYQELAKNEIALLLSVSLVFGIKSLIHISSTVVSLFIFGIVSVIAYSIILVLLKTKIFSVILRRQHL